MKPKNINILVVEDNELFRDTLSYFINQSSGFECNNSYFNCEDAINAIEKQKLKPNVILLDIGLPGMSGIEGLKHFSKLLPEAKIIILTIQDDNNNIFNALCNGAVGYLLKDSPADEIVEAIIEVLNGGAPMNSSIANKVLRMFKDFAPEQNDYQLTKRETETLKFLTGGINKEQIAKKMFVSRYTIDHHIRNIYTKLEVHSSTAAVAKAIKENLI